MKNMQTNDMEIEVLSKEEKREKRRQERMRSQKRAIIVLIVLILMLVGIVVSAVFLISKQKAAKMHQQEIQDQIAATNSVEDLEETEISTEENIVEEEATEIEVSQGEEENNDGTDIVDAKVLDEVVEAVISEMTLEEKAEEYRKNNCERWERDCLSVDDIAKENFLAGLKAGRPQWHNIKDREPSKEQLGKQLLIRMESIIGDTDYDYLVYKYKGESITDVRGVIAWCEIPTFDKE